MSLFNKLYSIAYGVSHTKLEKISLDRAMLIDMSYSEVIMSNIKLAFMSLVTILVFWRVIPHENLLAWLAIAYFVYALKIFDAFYFRKHKHEKSSTYWENRFMLLTLAVIIVWNAFIFMFFPHDNIEKQIVLTVLIIMITACGTTALAAYQKFFVPFQLLMLYPLVYEYTKSTGHAWILIAIYTAFVILNSNKIHGILLKSMKSKELELKQVEFEKNKKIEELLNNSGESFMVFDENLKIGNLYSATSKEIFGNPTGRDICDLLNMETDLCKHFGECVKDSIESSAQSEIFLSLLPKEFKIKSRYFNARYSKLFDNKIMLILSDSTETHKLNQQIKHDKTIVDLVKNSITDSANFFATIDEFNEFVKPDVWQTYDSSALYRIIHTYKGTFNQLGIVNTADCLHDIEEKLYNHTTSIPKEEIAQLYTLFESSLHKNLHIDITRLSDIMGKNFIQNRGIIAITPDQALLIEEQLKKSGILDDETVDEKTRKMLNELLLLRSKNLNTQLLQMESLIVRLGENLDKLIDFSITGEEVALPSEFTRSLTQQVGHLLRNAVDHGIETIDVRESLQKNEIGKINCHISLEDSFVKVTIQDDGIGINTEILKEKLEAKGYKISKDIKLIDLIKINGLSVSDKCTTISGRGIGIGSVAKWVESVNGVFDAKTQRGVGTIFTLIIPTEDNSLLRKHPRTS